MQIISKTHINNYNYDICVLGKENFHSTEFNEKSYKDMLDDNNYDIYALIENNKILGYIVFLKTDILEIISLCIDERQRNKGYAYFLLDKTLQKYKKYSKVILEVRSKNKNAIKLYEKFGFKKINIRKSYYNMPDDDAIIYCYEKRKEAL